MKRIFSAAVLAVFTVMGVSYASTDKVEFPKGYKDGVRYAVVKKEEDRRFGKSLRIMYINKVGADAVRAGKELPEGTVITMEVWAPKGGKDNPVRDAKGELQPGKLLAVLPMAKIPGANADVKPEIRNGDWEYARFKPNGERLGNADVTTCHSCHTRVQKNDYIFTWKQLQSLKK